MKHYVLLETVSGPDWDMLILNGSYISYAVTNCPESLILQTDQNKLNPRLSGDTAYFKTSPPTPEANATKKPYTITAEEIAADVAARAKLGLSPTKYTKSNNSTEASRDAALASLVTVDGVLAEGNYIRCTDEYEYCATRCPGANCYQCTEL